MISRQKSVDGKDGVDDQAHELVIPMPEASTVMVPFALSGITEIRLSLHPVRVSDGLATNPIEGIRSNR